MDVKPIKTEKDYQAALEEIEHLFDVEPNTPEGDRLEVLVTLVEAYESKHHPIFPPDPVEAIKYHLESRGLSRRDLEPYIGSRARVSEILNRRRRLTLRMIRNLEAGLGIPAEILIQPYNHAPAGEESEEVPECVAERSEPLHRRVLSREQKPSLDTESIVYASYDLTRREGFYVYVDTGAHASAPVQ